MFCSTLKIVAHKCSELGVSFTWNMVVMSVGAMVSHLKDRACSNSYIRGAGVIFRSIFICGQSARVAINY